MSGGRSEQRLAEVPPIELRRYAPGWPRLLDLHLAAAYLNLSTWTVRELVNDGTIPTVRLPRPQTLRSRRRGAVSGNIRRLLVDRIDLDAVVERWKEISP